MEGLVALGLAANIIQVVDAAVKAYNVCQEIYSLGASIDDSRMSFTSTELKDSHGILMDSLNRTSAHAGPAPGVDLKKLALRCAETATTLNKELQSLNKSPGGGFRKTVSKVVLKARKAKKLDELKCSLDEYQKALDSAVLIDIRHVE
ncbi:MAG: hypothetical protein Q9216_004194 [Gyalolechia sp. 2 TL-2023]